MLKTRLLIALGVAVCALVAAPAGAQQRVSIYTAHTANIVEKLIPEFEKKTGHKVRMTYIVINAMQQKLAAGEKPDMVLMPVPAIEARHTFYGWA